jgi:diguanylate cyclase (GGDEF)-like protein
MDSRSFNVLVATEDRALLRHLSRFLITFGYEVQQAAETQLARAALETDAVDLAILDGADGRSTIDLCRRIGDVDRRRPLYTLLMVHDPHPDDLVDAIEAGVDDFLRKPLVYGELLVRLRAAARGLEFERRIREQDCIEPLTGLPSRRAFCDRLRREFARTDDDALGACVVVDVDFFERINRRSGRAAGDRVIGAVARRLAELGEDAATLACFGGARFGVWLPGRSEPAAFDWAERARTALAEFEIAADDSGLRVTASLGVAAHVGGDESPETLVERALTALRAAKHSGRDWVARDGQFDRESLAWQDLAAPGKLFERTLARDVMTPCIALLRTDHPASRAAMLLQRTRLIALPVVDDRGKLAGIVSEAELAPAVPETASPRVGDLMSSEVSQFDEEASFAELIQFFQRAGGELIVVTDRGSPTGLVTPRNLTALSEPLKRDRFAPPTPYATTSDYLVVPEPCLVDEG